MREIKDGGPAFPGIEEPGGGYAGMTLRDYFAAAALTGMYASGGHKDVADEIRKEQARLDMNLSWPQIGAFAEARIADIAYAVADSMLKAREAK